MAEQRRKALQNLAEKRKMGKQMQQIPRIEFSETEFSALTGAAAGRKREEIIRKINKLPVKEIAASKTESVLKNNLKKLNMECVEGVPLGDGCSGLALPGGVRITIEKLNQIKTAEDRRAADLVEKNGGVLFRLTPEQAANKATAMLIRDEVQRRSGKRR